MKSHRFLGENFYEQNAPIPPNHILPTHNKSIFTTSANFLKYFTISHHLAPTFLLFPTILTQLFTIFHQLVLTLSTLYDLPT